MSKNQSNAVDENRKYYKCETGWKRWQKL